MSIQHGSGDRSAFAFNQPHFSVEDHDDEEYHPPATRLHPNYPPQHNESNPSISRTPSPNMKAKAMETGIPDRYIARTPSPTPSEDACLKENGIDWKKLRDWRFWFRREWLWYYVIFTILVVFLVLISVYERQIIHWLQPTAKKIKDQPGGWVIPIVIFFIISFPPLFGHEILAALCGVVWGTGIGFAITAAGTFLGEVGNFYAFRYLCHARGEKLERTNLRYAFLARVVRDGGFLVALIVRYSAIPGHFSTAIFSTCGMSIFVFSLAAALSLPKQFVTVYLGVVLEESGLGTESTTDKIMEYVVLTITGLITFLAMRFISKKIDAIKEDVIYQRRKARQAKLERANTDLEYAPASATFNPRESDSDLPLNPGENDAYQRWDSQGRAIGYAGDPRLHAPIPRKESAVANLPFRKAQREESTDNVSWDMGPDAYRLPTLSSHIPSTDEAAPMPFPPVVPSSPSARLNNPFERAESPGIVPALPPPPSESRSRTTFTNLYQQPQQPLVSSNPGSPIAHTTGLHRRESSGLPDRLPSPSL